MNRPVSCMIVLFTTLFVLSSHAQNRLGLVAGLNLANLNTDDGSDLKTRTGLAIGGIAELKVSEKASIQLEPVYVQKGAKIEETDPLLGTVTAKFKLDYLEVPILLRANLGSGDIRPYLKLGPTIAINLSSEAEIEIEGASFGVDVGDVFKSLDFGMAFGGGVSLPFGSSAAVFVEAGYALGLSNVIDEGSVSDGEEEVPIEGSAKTNAIQFLVGITFPLGGK